MFLNFDGSDHQFLVALDKNTGKTVWRKERSIDYKDLGPDGKPESEGDWRKAFGTPHVLPEARSRLAFVPERFVPPHYLTCREFIDLTLSLAGGEFEPEQVTRLFDELALDRGALDRPVRQLSKGMTQKLGLAGCFLVKRDLYLLDEPMSGLDPSSRVAVKSVLSRLTDEGRTLFFTSHVLSDVEELCSSMAVLDRGAIRFHGSPAGLCAQHGETHLEQAFIRCINGHDSVHLS